MVAAAGVGGRAMIEACGCRASTKALFEECSEPWWLSCRRSTAPTRDAMGLSPSLYVYPYEDESYSPSRSPPVRYEKLPARGVQIAAR